MAEKFDFDAALKALQSGQAITGKDGVLARTNAGICAALMRHEKKVVSMS